MTASVPPCDAQLASCLDVQDILTSTERAPTAQREPPSALAPMAQIPVTNSRYCGVKHVNATVIARENPTLVLANPAVAHNTSSARDVVVRILADAGFSAEEARTYVKNNQLDTSRVQELWSKLQEIALGSDSGRAIVALGLLNALKSGHKNDRGRHSTEALLLTNIASHLSLLRNRYFCNVVGSIVYLSDFLAGAPLEESAVDKTIDPNCRLQPGQAYEVVEGKVYALESPLAPKDPKTQAVYTLTSDNHADATLVEADARGAMTSIHDNLHPASLVAAARTVVSPHGLEVAILGVLDDFSATNDCVRNAPARARAQCVGQVQGTVISMLAPAGPEAAVVKASSRVAAAIKATMAMARSGHWLGGVFEPVFATAVGRGSVEAASVSVSAPAIRRAGAATGVLGVGIGVAGALGAKANGAAAPGLDTSFAMSGERPSKGASSRQPTKLEPPEATPNDPATIFDDAEDRLTRIKAMADLNRVIAQVQRVEPIFGESLGAYEPLLRDKWRALVDSVRRKQLTVKQARAQFSEFGREAGALCVERVSNLMLRPRVRATWGRTLSHPQQIKFFSSGVVGVFMRSVWYMDRALERLHR